MSYARFAALKPTLSRALLILALPSACATEVTPDFGDPGDPSQPADTAGSSAGGAPSTAGSTTVLPHAGTTTTSAGAATNPFGGTSSAGGSIAGASSAGTSNGGTSSGGASSGGASKGGSSAGGKGGSSSGGATGAGGSAAGTGGSATGGGATSGCACPAPKTWADNTNLSFGPGDCVDVAGKVYLYTGTKAQTWANKDCNPTMQLAWCSDVGADYKFMLCK
jgi:hypothetical protein